MKKGSTANRIARYPLPIAIRRYFMRTLFLLLVLVNAGFYAYSYVTREGSAVQTAGPELQINAERIRIMKQAKGAPAVCLEWGGLTGPDIARADTALAGLELPAEGVQRVAAEAPGFWVHIPPLKSKAELDKKMGELKSAGITDFSAVQDPTLGRNAISLGIFSTEDAARGRLAALKEKGVQSAVMESRAGLIKQARYYVREPRTNIVSKLAELQQGFPGSQIKAGPCPAPEAVKN